MSEPIGPRLFVAYDPPPAELAQAKEKLARDQCPRRYCWHWHSLQFDWEMKPEEGCQVADQHIGQLTMARHEDPVLPWRQCCRASGNPQHEDHYEPREPHLKADGWPQDYFLVVGKRARRRRFTRRQRGQKRKEKE